MHAKGLMAEIIGSVREEYEDLGVSIPSSDIRGRSRVRVVSQARAAVARRAYETGLVTLDTIGAELGGRDHSTVRYLIIQAGGQTHADRVAELAKGGE